MAEEKIIKIGGANATKRASEEKAAPKKRTRKKKVETNTEELKVINTSESPVMFTEVDTDNGINIKGEVNVDKVETSPAEENKDVAVEYAGDKKLDAPKKSLVGDPNCFVFFSMNKTHEGVDADIIDIAFTSNIKDSNGKFKSFYVQFNDYDMKKLDGSTFERVIKNLPKNADIIGNRLEVGLAIYEWLLANFITNEIFVQFVTSCNVYEFGLLKQLIKDTGKDISFMSPIVVDVNQDLATGFFCPENPDKNYVPVYTAAAAMTKEQVLKTFTKENEIWDEVQQIENPALKNASIFKYIHWFLWGQY